MRRTLSPGAEGESRTPTRLSPHRGLSPERLPVPATPACARWGGHPLRPPDDGTRTDRPGLMQSCPAVRTIMHDYGPAWYLSSECPTRFELAPQPRQGRMLPLTPRTHWAVYVSPRRVCSRRTVRSLGTFPIALPIELPGAYQVTPDHQLPGGIRTRTHGT